MNPAAALAETPILTDEHLRSRDEDGYLILDILFDDDELECLRDHMARVFFDGAYETGTAPRSVLWASSRLGVDAARD
jgi:hypothetical protein